MRHYEKAIKRPKKKDLCPKIIKNRRKMPKISQNGRKNLPDRMETVHHLMTFLQNAEALVLSSFSEFELCAVYARLFR